MSLRKMHAILALTIALSGVSVAAKADTLRWFITSDYPYVVSLEFYSQKYNRAWPGNGKVWLIDDYQTHEYNLECETGEQICYGAWARGDSDTYWGVGPNNSHGCTSCCGVCGKGDMRGITLTP
jgi:hypothetical protein